MQSVAHLGVTLNIQLLNTKWKSSNDTFHRTHQAVASCTHTPQYNSHVRSTSNSSKPGNRNTTIQHNTIQHHTIQHHATQYNTTSDTIYSGIPPRTHSLTHLLTHSLHVCLHVCFHVLPALAVLLYWPRFSTIAMSFSFTHLKQQQSRSDMMEGSLYYSGNNIVSVWVSEWVVNNSSLPSTNT
jgi:hypothetical protein